MLSAYRSPRFEDRKQKQLDKKFNKKSQAAKTKKKAEQKKETMKQVNSWKKNANENDSILDGKKLGRGGDGPKKLLLAGQLVPPGMHRRCRHAASCRCAVAHMRS